ncbi:MAG: TonB-dependent receptor [Elusimicrobiota bacterium]|jgi:outer membrane cobalamin receptor|nr:TonB-dependent receptor [Elusimicrobiota bacterium]
MKKVVLSAVFCTLFLHAFPSEIQILLSGRPAAENAPATITEVQTVKPADSYDSVGDLLETAAQIFVKDNGFGTAQTVFIKGQNKGVLIIVDGVRLPQDSTGMTDISNIPVETIESIKILEGPQVEYGPSASNGVVIIKTKTAQEGVTKGTAGISYGSFNTANAAFEITGNIAKTPLSYAFNAAQLSSGGFRENSAFDRNNYSGSLAYNFNKESRLILSSSYNQNHLRLSGGTNIAPDEWNGHKERAASTPNDWMKQDLVNSGLAFENPDFFANAGYSQNRFRVYNENAAWPPSTYDDYSVHNVSGGVSYRGVENFVIGADYLFTQLSGEINWANGDTKKAESNYGAFAKYSLNLGKLLLRPAVRAEYNSMYDETFTGTLLAQFNLTKKDAVFAEIGQGSRTPTIGERGYFSWGSLVTANPDLKREKTKIIEYGLKANLLKTDWKISGYYVKYDDMIDFNDTWTEYVNIKKAATKGLKISAATSAGIFDNYMGVDFSKNLDGGGKKIYGRPEILASANTGVKIGRARIFHTADIAKMTPPAGKSSWRWVNLGIGAEYKFGGALSLTASLDNYLNKYYTKNWSSQGAYPEPGRTFKLGMKYNFWN